MCDYNILFQCGYVYGKGMCWAQMVAGSQGVKLAAVSTQKFFLILLFMGNILKNMCVCRDNNKSD